MNNVYICNKRFQQSSTEGASHFFLLGKGPFPSYKRFLTPLQQTAFWKHGDNRRSCSRRAISPFVTMFSTLFNYWTFILREFKKKLGYVFKVVCCRFVVCGKRLSFNPFPYTTILQQMTMNVFCQNIEHRRFLTPLQQTAFWKHSDKRRNRTKRAISPFATMFSTFCHRLSIQL